MKNTFIFISTALLLAACCESDVLQHKLVNNYDLTTDRFLYNVRDIPATLGGVVIEW